LLLEEPSYYVMAFVPGLILRNLPQAPGER